MIDSKRQKTNILYRFYCMKDKFMVYLKRSHSNQLYKGKNLYLHSEFYFDFIYKISRKRQKINIHYKC